MKNVSPNGVHTYADIRRSIRWTGSGIDVERQVLIGFDLLLVLVVGLILYAIVARVSELGFSPNKVAALGENLILLVSLGWSAVLYARFLARRTPFTQLEKWQTAYLPVYGLWAWVVVVVFPLVFSFQ